MAGQVMIVSGQINGQGAYNFIIDTGASDTVVTPPTAQALGLKTYAAGAGQKVAVETSVTIGGETVDGLSVYVFDPLQAVSLRLNQGVNYHGIVGYDFLSQFVTTINYRKKIISLLRQPPLLPGSRPDPQIPASDGSVRVPFQIVDKMIHVNGYANGRGPLTFLVDTGAAENVMTPQSARAIGLEGKQSSTQPGVAFAALDRLAVGKVELVKVPIVIHMPPQENQRTVGYHGILGYPWLAQFEVTIDYRAKCLLLEPLGPSSK
jgi:predicted aspartyl protease